MTLARAGLIQSTVSLDQKQTADAPTPPRLECAFAIDMQRVRDSPSITSPAITSTLFLYYYYYYYFLRDTPPITSPSITSILLLLLLSSSSFLFFLTRYSSYHFYLRCSIHDFDRSTYLRSLHSICAHRKTQEGGIYRPRVVGSHI